MQLVDERRQGDVHDRRVEIDRKRGQKQRDEDQRLGSYRREELHDGVLSAQRVRPLLRSSAVLPGGIGEWVEGLEGSVARDCELELVACARVGDGERHGVLARVPEQDDLDAVALAAGELASVILDRRGPQFAHGSSVGGRGEDCGGLGLRHSLLLSRAGHSTGLTLTMGMPRSRNRSRRPCSWAWSAKWPMSEVSPPCDSSSSSANALAKDEPRPPRTTTR